MDDIFDRFNIVGILVVIRLVSLCNLFIGLMVNWIRMVDEGRQSSKDKSFFQTLRTEKAVSIMHTPELETLLEAQISGGAESAETLASNSPGLLA